MLVGYNTNITYKGVVYHVQTEDSGTKNPMIVTLLYHQGVILSSKKTSYADIASAPDYRERVRELMKEQHKNMIKELIHGKHIQAGPAEAQPADAVAEPLPEPAPVAAEPVSPVLTEEKQEAPAAKQESQEPKTLDDILLDYIIKGK